MSERVAVVFVSLLCTAGEPEVMVWGVREGEFALVALLPLSRLREAA